jgi:hypothetical protein
MTANQLRVLDQANEHLQALRDTVSDSNVTFVAVDVEAWELDHRVVLEVGLSVAANTAQSVISSAHYIIEETKDFRNGKFVPDNKDDFRFGVSATVPQKELAATILSWLQVKIPIGTKVVLVGHSLGNDKKWLQGVGVDVYAIASTTVDVAMVEQAITTQHAKVKLEKMAEKYGVEKKDWSGWHCAANDCHMTLLVLQKQQEAVM